MNREEALEKLKSAPRTNKPCRVNPAFTQAAFVDLIVSVIVAKEPGTAITGILEKRVLQACQNRKRPTYA